MHRRIALSYKSWNNGIWGSIASVYRLGSSKKINGIKTKLLRVISRVTIQQTQLIFSNVA